MFEEFGTVIPRKKREDLRYRWKLSNLLTFLADTETSISEFATKNKKINTLSKKPLSKREVLREVWCNDNEVLSTKCFSTNTDIFINTKYRTTD